MFATEALLAEYGKSISGSTFVIQVGHSGLPKYFYKMVKRE